MMIAPQPRNRFRLIFEDYPHLSTQVISANVDLLQREVEITLRETTGIDVIRALEDFFTTRRDIRAEFITTADKVSGSVALLNVRLREHLFVLDYQDAAPVVHTIKISFSEHKTV